ncbi:Alb1p KNAG_0J02590 [Huiozyma naganishii CBS 8797]|uniref:Ribosome biogenesis protein ALB1 n=1 Tax=Huiozyma naganishii (strain ATCC MYA-139 / BCRC 22969 / CBS 8797 / KCTC 17520 / NBRC 10181 / NCYC 3082 / Yp74L-3) TaxID=1071383 RepID=J7RR62_HUIN7|nr:hypothetical protein KNAG_0J02590 [Kazachstania naganishii CBS 8797]CCK72338.1 hypothetical protein KNAG_0J02590 [Kazachstania naganishii CBS 8797]
MPSKNSVNRPKLTANLRRRAQKLGQKRARRTAQGHFALGREDALGAGKSAPLDVYFGRVGVQGSHAEGSKDGRVTSRTLSGKRLRKIERNLRYAKKRQGKEQKQAPPASAPAGPLTALRNALWSVLGDSPSAGLIIDTTGNAGTTLGGAYFP